VTKVAAVAVVLALVPTVPAGTWAQPTSVNPAVFLVVVLDLSTHGAVETGTGFFINSDGTALTVSHLASLVTLNPTKRLAAVVSGEVYAADVVCASRLSYDPTISVPGLYSLHTGSRDVAEIKLRPGNDLPLPGGVLSWQTLDGQQVQLATAHTGALPAFPALQMGKGMGSGDSVAVIGYAGPNSAMTQDRALGTVRSVERAPDRTPVGVLQFGAGPAPVAGFSGAPVLNTAGQVVGMLAWIDASNHTQGYAEGSQALMPACR